MPPQSGAPVALDQLLQPGAVIEARVLAQLDASLVRILIANVPIDVATQTPLVPGTVLRLAVSTAPDGGVRLSATPMPTSASTPTSAPTAEPIPPVQSLPSPRVNVAPDPSSVAVAQAVSRAAPRQSGLSPLFADLAAALEQGQLPPQVRAAVAPLLALRPALSSGVTAPQVQQALQRSGLLLEASVAAGRPPQVQTSGQMPDLKAALIVLRQVLSQWQSAVAPTTVAPPSVPATAAAAVMGPALAPTPVPSPAMPVQTPAPPTSVLTQPAPAANSRAAAPSLVPDDFIVPLATPQSTHSQPQSVTALRASIASPDLVMTLLQDIAQGEAAARTPATPAHNAAPMEIPAAIARTSADTPPPPFRGAAPSAQPVALPSLHPDDAPSVVVHKLVEDVDGALARQTLLQIASLPDQPLQHAQRMDQPRWAFEIPFATPQGTAVAQFEISRDGHSPQEVEPAKRIWRARFSLNVEPAGPVHASIALIGQRASVRLWADRPETIARLRDSTPLLSHALREAELDPGEITVGRPPQSAPVAAGQFWNRAS